MAAASRLHLCFGMRGTSIVLIVLCGLLTLGGCAATCDCGKRKAKPVPQDSSRAPVDRDRPHSMALDSPQQQFARGISGDYTPAEQQWYSSRNDQQLTTWGGYREAIVEETTTRTLDQQRHRDGRVFDTYRSSTFRETRTTVVR